MAANAMDAIDISGIPELEIVRVFDAPRALVFKAWLDPGRLAQWWGPEGFANPVCELDARAGGAIRVVMQAPNGARYPMGGNYEEIDEPKRLALYTQGEDASGKVLLRNRVTVRFEEEGAKTRLILRVKVVHATARAKQMLAGHQQGWTESIDRLGMLVSQTRPFNISREFNAPRALLFAVHTDPAHLGRWQCPPGCTVIHASMDLRPRGEYRYGLRLPNGAELWGKQVYVEVQAPDRLVYIQSFTDKEGGIVPNPMSPVWPLEMLATLSFEAVSATKSRLSVVWKPVRATDEQSAAFDAAHGGMSGGFKGTFEQLENYLKTL